jgi:hypothetical protein
MTSGKLKHVDVIINFTIIYVKYVHLVISFIVVVCIQLLPLNVDSIYTLFPPLTSSGTVKPKECRPYYLKTKTPYCHFRLTLSII